MKVGGIFHSRIEKKLQMKMIKKKKRIIAKFYYK